MRFHQYSTEDEKQAAQVVSVIFVILAVVIIIGTYYLFGHDSRRDYRISRGGTRITAEITSIGEGSTGSLPVVTYKFVVEDKTFHGSQTVSLEKRSMIADETTIAVRYDPTNPYRSFVEPTDRVGYYIFLTIAGIVVLGLIFMLLAMWVFPNPDKVGCY